MARAIKLAIGDLIVTFAWMFSASTLGIWHYLISRQFQLQSVPYADVAVNGLLFFVLTFVFNVIGEALGGASFNPAGSASFYAAGLGDDTLFSMALRFPAQAAGAAAGALAILEVVPKQYKHLVMGPSLKVDLHTGAIAEGVLTFGISFFVLLIVLKGPRNKILQAFLLAVVIVSFVMAGSPYTGPSMNPANAFGWAYIANSHKTWEQFYVYWICPFIGAIVASWFFRIVFPAPAPKKKQQKKKKKTA